MGQFETERQYARSGVQLWRGSTPSQVGEVSASEVHLNPRTDICLCLEALCEWHLGEIDSDKKNVAEAISLAKELNDAYALTESLFFAAMLGYFDRKPAEVERLTSDLIEVSTHHHFALYLAGGEILRGWARSVSGILAEGIWWIEHGIQSWRATGATLALPLWLGLKAETLHLADRTSQALEAIREAEAFAERFEEGLWYAELHRLRGVFLSDLGAEKTQIGASFGEAIRIAKEQNSVSLVCLKYYPS